MKSVKSKVDHPKILSFHGPGPRVDQVWDQVWYQIRDQVRITIRIKLGDKFNEFN